MSEISERLKPGTTLNCNTAAYYAIIGEQVVLSHESFFRKFTEDEIKNKDIDTAGGFKPLSFNDSLTVDKVVNEDSIDNIYFKGLPVPYPMYTVEESEKWIKVAEETEKLALKNKKEPETSVKTIEIGDLTWSVEGDQVVDNNDEGLSIPVSIIKAHLKIVSLLEDEKNAQYIDAEEYSVSLDVVEFSFNDFKKLQTLF